MDKLVSPAQMLPKLKLADKQRYVNNPTGWLGEMGVKFSDRANKHPIHILDGNSKPRRI